MGNVNLPTPVAMAGGAICILGGYLLGVVTGPDTATRTTAVVESYDDGSGRLCLSGEGIEEQEGSIVDGVLCGTWRRTVGSSTVPEQGDMFRFVSLSGEDSPEGKEATTVIYGNVVR